MHVGLVAFIMVGLILILAGKVRSWRWVRNPWFRFAHLGTIGIVMLESWLDIPCPLTSLEMYWRAKAGDPTYEGGFIAHELHRLLFFDAPDWCFVLGYTLFGLAVGLSWMGIRPRPFFAKRGAAG